MTTTGVDRQTAVVLGFGGGEQAVLHAALDTRGPNTAIVLGTRGRIELSSVWYTPTTLTVYDSAGEQTERFDGTVRGRGMQFQAWELERLVREGATGGEILPPGETVRIMEVLDEIRRQIGLEYPPAHSEAAPVS
jgi:hypothetical protein